MFAKLQHEAVPGEHLGRSQNGGLGACHFHVRVHQSWAKPAKISSQSFKQGGEGQDHAPPFRGGDVDLRDHRAVAGLRAHAARDRVQIYEKLRKVGLFGLWTLQIQRLRCPRSPITALERRLKPACPCLGSGPSFRASPKRVHQGAFFSTCKLLSILLGFTVYDIL